MIRGTFMIIIPINLDYFLAYDVFIQVLIVLGLLTLVSAPLWILSRIIRGIARFIRSKKNPISRKRRRRWNKTRDRIYQSIEGKGLQQND